MKRIGFFQDKDGNNSISRLVGFITICVSLFYCGVILYLSRHDVMTAAAAIGIVFGSMTVTSFAFLFAQKKTEASTEINSKTNDTMAKIVKTEPTDPTV